MRVKDEPICDRTKEAKRQSILVKEEPIDIEMQTSKYQIEVKVEEKFSAIEEFANKASFAFLNEETTSTTNDNNPITNQAKTSNSEPNKAQNSYKTNKLQNSK